MKKNVIALIVIAVIIGIMVATVPSPEKHRSLLKVKIHEKIDEAPIPPVERWALKKLNNMFVNQLGIQNCFVFNMSYDVDENERKYVSVGVFNQVILLSSFNVDEIH